MAEELRYVIGLEDNGLLIEPLVTNRMHHAVNGGVSLLIGEAPGRGAGFCTVEITGKGGNEGARVLCDLLADIIIENLQIRHLINLLRQKYDFLSEKSQCELLIKTLKMLWYGKNDVKNGVMQCKRDVSQRLAVFLTESEDRELVLEGFMRFRMKDYINRWKSLLKKNVDEYMMEKEYKEFIGVLRYFVLLREPKNITIHLNYNEKDGYALSDSQKNSIMDDGLKSTGSAMRQKMTREDIVLSALINISPEKIVIHNSRNITEKRLLMTIKNVFLDRVVFDDS